MQMDKEENAIHDLPRLQEKTVSYLIDQIR